MLSHQAYKNSHIPFHHRTKLFMYNLRLHKVVFQRQTTQPGRHNLYNTDNGSISSSVQIFPQLCRSSPQVPPQKSRMLYPRCASDLCCINAVSLELADLPQSRHGIIRCHDIFRRRSRRLTHHCIQSGQCLCSKPKHRSELWLSKSSSRQPTTTNLQKLRMFAFH